MNILEEADKLTREDRQKDYGHPLDNHTQTAEMVSAYLKKKLKEPLTAEDMCMIQILLKVSRFSHSAKRDTLIDIPGYARNIEMMDEERKRRAVDNSDGQKS